jgi:hypothetical protein
MLRAFALTLGLLFVSAPAMATPKIGADKWQAVFGTKADGAIPTIFKGLARDMGPADAGKVIKGADKPSKHGFAKITVKGVNGVKKMEMWFMKDKETKKVPTLLRSATLVLDAAVLKDRASYDALLEVLVAKYGPLPKNADVDNFKITWAIGNMQTVQIWKIGRDVTFKFGF